MRTLRLSLLGSLQVSLGAESLTRFESNKVRALLAVLAVEQRRPHSREALAEMLWPETSTRSALADLRYALADLRRVIGDNEADPPFLLISRERLQFNASSHYALDLSEFEELARSAEVSRLEQAIALVRGDFLAGFPSIQSPAFEQWLLARREQLTLSVQKVLSSLAGHYERKGSFQQALCFARQRLDIDPLDEDVHEQVMRLLAFDGQRSAALAQYETCKDLLRQELDAAPSAQTTTLYESIREGGLYIPMHFVASAAAGGASMPDPPFVAREEELLALTGRLEEALAGQGCVAFVMGEAGSGKTTLAKEFLRRSSLAHPDVVALYGNCNSFAGSTDPYLPFIELFRMLAGDIGTQQASGYADGEQSRRIWDVLPTVIRALLEFGPDLIDRFIPGEELLARARTLAHFQTNRLEQLVREKAGHVRPSEPGASSHRQSELLRQICSVIRGVSRANPILIVLDDLQWADPDTVNLLFYMCRRLDGSRTLIIGTYRSQDRGAPARAAVSAIFPALRELQAASGHAPLDLSRSDAHRFVNAFLDSQPNALDADFRAALERHTAGIPLFVVELVHGMRERGDLLRDEAGRWIVSQALDWDILPPRVEAVIARQTDELSDEWRSTLSAASVEGDEFSAEIIASVLDRPPEQVISCLSGPLSRVHHIVVALGVQRAGRAGNHLSRYRFRHHLFQRYFESSQDVIERFRLHEAVGNALEAFYGGQTDEIAVPLARHFEFANLYEKAASYLLVAGHKAQRLFANEEAIQHFQRGLDLITLLPDGPERDRLELQLQIAIGQPIIATQGHNSSAIEKAYSRARQLVERCGDRKDLFQVLSLLKSYYNLRGNRTGSEETAWEMLRIAEETGDTELLVTAAVKMVTNSFYYGQWAEFRRYIDKTTQLYDPEKHRLLTYRIGADPKGQALGLGAMGFWMLGYPDQARRCAEGALAQERDVAIPMWSFFAYYYVASFHVYAEELAAARHFVDKALRVCREQGMSHYLIYTESMLGWLMARSGDQSGILKLERGTAWLQEIGDRMNSLPLLRLLADACRAHCLRTKGLETVEKALAIARETEMVFDEPELWRLKGELLLLDPAISPAAEEALTRAIESASTQGTKMWELRATVSLARLWRQQGREELARCKLEKLYSWFEEGFETADLRKARDLLDEVGVGDAERCHSLASG